MQLKYFPHLCKLISYQADDLGLKLLEDFGTVDVVSNSDFDEAELKSMEASAADFDGKEVCTFVDLNEWPNYEGEAATDALEFIGRNVDSSLALAILASTKSEQIEDFLNDAFEGDLGVALYE